LCCDSQLLTGSQRDSVNLIRQRDAGRCKAVARLYMQILGISIRLFVLYNENKTPPPPILPHRTAPIKAGNGGANSSNYNAAVSIAITVVFCLCFSNMPLGSDTYVLVIFKACFVTAYYFTLLVWERIGINIWVTKAVKRR